MAEVVTILQHAVGITLSSTEVEEVGTLEIKKHRDIVPAYGATHYGGTEVFQHYTALPVPDSQTLSPRGRILHCLILN